MGLRLRLLAILFLAVLPVVWSYCPCCVVGAGGAPLASRASKPGPARRLCPCCERKGKESPSKEGEAPALPKDCDGCAASYARAGALTAPAHVALPALDVRAGVPVPTFEALRPLEATPIARPFGPAPPGPRLWPLSTVVLLI